jgi:hypothetical protein
MIDIKSPLGTILLTNFFINIQGTIQNLSICVNYFMSESEFEKLIDLFKELPSSHYYGLKISLIENPNASNFIKLLRSLSKITSIRLNLQLKIKNY